MQIRVDLADKSNYVSSSKRKLSNVKYIVVHYTGNDGDSAQANINYFKGKNRKASAHYFVDNKEIICSVPVEHTAGHCGGNLYGDIKSTGGGKLYGIVKNANSIGIEMCDVIRDGKYALNSEVKKNVISLIVYLMREYNISIDNVVRHFDVTGKHCPSYFCKPNNVNGDRDWLLFKQDIMKEFNGEVDKGQDIIDKGQDISKEYKIKVTVNTLNVRASNTTNSKVTGVIKDKGVYTIVETKGDWGKLKSGLGWIYLTYTKKYK